MKRDMDLIRLLLIKEEGVQIVDLSPYSPDQISFHQALLIEADFVVGITNYSRRGGPDKIPAVVFIHRITWKGYEYLETVRNDNLWKNIKDKIAEKGLSLSVDFIFSCAKIIGNSLLNE